MDLFYSRFSQGFKCGQKPVFSHVKMRISNSECMIYVYQKPLSLRKREYNKSSEQDKRCIQRESQCIQFTVITLAQISTFQILYSWILNSSKDTNLSVLNTWIQISKRRGIMLTD